MYNSDQCQEHANLVKTMEELLQAVKKIERALLGDIDSQKPGMINEIHDLKKRVAEIEAFHKDIKSKFSNLIYKIISVAIVSLLTGAGILKLIEKIF